MLFGSRARSVDLSPAVSAAPLPTLLRPQPLPLAFLTNALGEHQAVARTIVAEDGHYGHAVISRWPMTQPSTSG